MINLTNYNKNRTNLLEIVTTVDFLVKTLKTDSTKSKYRSASRCQPSIDTPDKLVIDEIAFSQIQFNFSSSISF